MKAFFDTNIYISHYRRGLHCDLLHQINSEYLLYLHVVVLAELYAGAQSKAFLKELKRIEKIFVAKNRIIVPYQEDYILAGHFLNKLKGQLSFTDALLAASARSRGMTLFSEDKDFEEVKKIKLFSFQRVTQPTH